MEEQRKEFTGVWIPRHVIEDEELSMTDKIIYAEIACFNICYKSNEKLGERYGLKANTISICISKLIKKGYVISYGVKEGRFRELVAKTDKPNQRQGMKKIKGTLSEKSKAGYEKNQTIDNSIENNIDNKNIPPANAEVVSKNKYTKEEIQAYTEIIDSYEINGIQTKDTKNKWFSVKSQKDACITLLKESGNIKKALLYPELIGKILKFRLENSNPQEDEKRKYFELYNFKVPVTPYELMKNFTQYRITLRKCAIQLSEKNV